VPVKLKLEVPTVNVDAGAPTVNITGIDCGELVAPVPMTVIEAVYVPAERPVAFTVAASEPGPLPDTGDTESQGVVLVAFQLKVPVPVFVMFTV
jgi:hypothetical protein